MVIRVDPDQGKTVNSVQAGRGAFAPVDIAVIIVVKVGPDQPAIRIICVGLAPVDRAVRVAVEIGPGPPAAAINV